METRKAKRLLAGALALAAVLSAAPQVQADAAKKPLIEKTKAWQAVSADVTLNGSGTGYHAKLRFSNSVAGVSYGIQYDSAAVAPYTGKAMLLIENVKSNSKGGQEYIRPQDIEVPLGQKVNLMMTLSKTGHVDVYYNGECIGSCQNDNLIRHDYYSLLSTVVEGAARLNGDRVDALFENIRTRYESDTSGKYFSVHGDSKNPGIKVDYDERYNDMYMVPDKVRISGQITLPNWADWDRAYNEVQGVCAFLHDKRLHKLKEAREAKRLKSR